MFFAIAPSVRGRELVNRPSEATTWKHQTDVTMSSDHQTIKTHQNCFQTLDRRKPKRRRGHLKFTTCHVCQRCHSCHHFWEAYQLARAMDLAGWFRLRKTRWTEAAWDSDCALCDSEFWFSAADAGAWARRERGWMKHVPQSRIF